MVRRSSSVNELNASGSSNSIGEWRGQRWSRSGRFLTRPTNSTGPVRTGCLYRHAFGETGQQTNSDLSVDCICSRCRLQVLIVSDSVTNVAAYVQMFAALLTPFQWQHTLVPVLPDTSADLVDSPTPYLHGLLRLLSTP